MPGLDSANTPHPLAPADTIPYCTYRAVLLTWAGKTSGPPESPLKERDGIIHHINPFTAKLLDTYWHVSMVPFPLAHN